MLTRIGSGEVTATPMRRVAQLLGYSKTSVYRHRTKFIESSSLDLKRARDRKMKLSVMQMHQLKAWALEEPKASAGHLAAKWEQLYGHSLSANTVRRCLKRLSVSKKRAAKGPLLTSATKAARVTWCQANLHRNWNNVLFTDEARFQLHSNYVRVWTCRNARRPSFNRLVKSPSINVYAAISSKGKICLFFSSQNFNTEVYCDVVELIVNPVATELFPSGFILQRDNAPCHRSFAAQDRMEELGMQILPWPSYSPDLNIIENVWAWLKQEVEKKLPTGVLDLKNKIQEAWDEMPQQIINNLFSSINTRLTECISVGGEKVDY